MDRRGRRCVRGRARGGRRGVRVRQPGSTELAFLDALGRSELEYVTCLHEGIAVGAADGYARVSRRAGVVQLHTAAGVGNAAGMLGNANVGGTPLVVYVGCPARADAYAEPVLGGDPVAVAAPVSKWAWELRTADEIPRSWRARSRSRSRRRSGRSCSSRGRT